MPVKTALVVTSISEPNAALRSLASGCANRNIDFYLIGDVASPANLSLEGCDYHDVERQRRSGFRYARICPTKRYARKNIGYLLAIRAGASILIETDDDNYPLPSFWRERHRKQTVSTVRDAGWTNVYRYFADEIIWPRGLPLDAVKTPAPGLYRQAEVDADYPIQQGLVDNDPDVDAIYRLTLPLPRKFQPNISVGLGKNTWCPFNSQNTTWWADAYPLLYLPSTCPFRLTDIWRSFVAQRIAWENEWSVLFESSTMWQERNDHDLMRDFREEIDGYVHNRTIADRLASAKLRPGLSELGNNLHICYDLLAGGGWVHADEIPLLDAWLGDLEGARPQGFASAVSGNR